MQVLPLKFLDELAALCKKHSLPIHMDGARLFNAVESSKETPARIVRDCDSVSVCFSKGLSAPVGSALVGSCHFIGQLVFWLYLLNQLPICVFARFCPRLRPECRLSQSKATCSIKNQCIFVLNFIDIGAAI